MTHLATELRDCESANECIAILRQLHGIGLHELECVELFEQWLKMREHRLRGRKILSEVFAT